MPRRSSFQRSSITKRGTTIFFLPVDPPIKIAHSYGEQGDKWPHVFDETTGFWRPRISSDPFGYHPGIDFIVPHGTPVKAMTDGFVVRARWDVPVNHSLGRGLFIAQLVSEMHHDSWTLRYCHLSSLRVSIGQTVAMGDVIGYSGDSGDANGTYLHVDLMDLKGQFRKIPEWQI